MFHVPMPLQIMLPVFGSEEEPSPSALYENNDVVTINVFDEFINSRWEGRTPPRNRCGEWLGCWVLCLCAYLNAIAGPCACI